MTAVGAGRLGGPVHPPPALLDAFDEAIAGDGASGATGWVLHATGPAGALDAAGGVDGLGVPVGPTTAFHVYCAIKPLLAVAVGVLVDRGELSFDDRVADVLGDVFRWPPFGATTIRELLTHRSGMVAPSAVASTILDPDARVAAALDAPPLDEALGPDDSAYSEAAAWIVLGAVVEVLVERRLSSWVRDEVLVPLALATELDLEEEPGGSLGLNVTVTRGRRLPLLIERTTALRWDANPGHGGRATMRGLAGILAELDAAERGAGRLLSVAAAQDVLRPEVARFDRRLGIRCRFGAGVMCGLADHGFGRAVGDGAFGHGGLVGMTTSWCDPDRGVVASYHLNGLCPPDRALSLRRPELVALVTRAVAAVPF